MRTLRFIAYTVVLLLTPALAAAQQGGEQQSVRVAVLGMNAASITGSFDHAAIGESLTSMMMSEFGNRRTITLIERQRVADLLDQRFAGASGRIDNAAAVELGGLLGADYVVYGSVTMAGDDARFDVRITQVETSQIHRTFTQTGRQRDFLGIVESVANQLLQDLRLPERVVDVVVPPAAVLAYSRGLDFERRGDRRRAADMFQRALEIFPDHAAAARALARVR